jgi:preprotein translocase subunit YajC
MRESTTASEFQALPGTNFSDFFPIRNTLFFFFFFFFFSLSQNEKKKKKKQNKTKQINKQTLGSIIAVVVAQNIHE